MTTERQISMATYVAGVSALVIAAAMGVYAVYQYSTEPNATFMSLAFKHSWHVVVLGVLTYLALHSLLYYSVVRPIQQLYVKLYAIPRGDTHPLFVPTRIREIGQIVESVNLLLQELEQANPDTWKADMEVQATALRTLAAKTSNEFDNGDRERLRLIASKLDQSIVEAEKARRPFS